MIKVDAIQNTINSGQNTYTVFVCFISSLDILKIASVPSFSRNSSNQDISQKLLNPPVSDWQRPIDLDRVNVISDLFNDTGEFMPNPVLLGENKFSGEQILINPKLINNTHSGIYEIKFNDTLDEDNKQLWILDGQHRINGLGKSKQKNNPVPIVLLLDSGSGTYPPEILAKIFAQVTTTNQKLDDLHNEWLTYTFSLEKYKNSIERQKSMKTVCFLSFNQTFNNFNNPFLNQIQFNSFYNNNNKKNGYDISCIILQKLLYDHYYNLPNSNHLDPHVLAEQICLSFLALERNVQNCTESVFFGTQNYYQEIARHAFFVGILSFLRKFGIPPSWDTILNKLTFNNCNWKFDWINTLSGTNNTNSKKIITEIFKYMFENQNLPPNSHPQLIDFLKGNNASFELQTSQLTPSGKPSKKNKKSRLLTVGNTNVSENCVTHQHLKIINKTLNIGLIKILDKSGSIANPKTFSEQGFIVSHQNNNPLQLEINLSFYGGTSGSVTINITW